LNIISPHIKLLICIQPRYQVFFLHRGNTIGHRRTHTSRQSLLSTPEKRRDAGPYQALLRLKMLYQAPVVVHMAATSRNKNILASIL
jgi:hypothetical protein